jgi:fatty acyl-CoA reductase
MIADTRVIADLVPVDLPVNMLIAVAWARANASRTATSVSQANSAAIYHMTTGGLNPFTWGEMENAVVSYFKTNPMESCFRRPKVNILTSNRFVLSNSVFVDLDDRTIVSSRDLQ